MASPGLKVYRAPMNLAQTLDSAQAGADGR